MIDDEDLKLIQKYFFDQKKSKPVLSPRDFFYNKKSDEDDSNEKFFDSYYKR